MLSCPTGMNQSLHHLIPKHPFRGGFQVVDNLSDLYFVFHAPVLTLNKSPATMPDHCNEIKPVISMYERHLVSSPVYSAHRMLWFLFTHSDLPVQDISGDVDSSHGLTTKHELGSGQEDPAVRVQMTFTLYFLKISCKVADMKKRVNNTGWTVHSRQWFYVGLMSVKEQGGQLAFERFTRYNLFKIS